MRLPQQRQMVNKLSGHARGAQLRATDTTIVGALERSVRPSHNSGGTADCVARCRLLPPGQRRDECIRDCY